MSLKGISNKKLAAKFVGPFRVVKKIGSVSYKLSLPPSSQLHDVFHVSLLKPYEGILPTEPAAIEVDGESEYEVEDILDHRPTRGTMRYLVKWLGYDNSHNEWVKEEDLHADAILSRYKTLHRLD